MGRPRPRPARPVQHHRLPRRLPDGTAATAGDDARRAAWWPLDALPEHLAFDHADILTAALTA